MPGYLQGLAIEAQHIDRLVEHGLRQQGVAVPAPRHALRPASSLGLRDERELAPFHTVDHDQAVVIVRLMGEWSILSLVLPSPPWLPASLIFTEATSNDRVAPAAVMAKRTLTNNLLILRIAGDSAASSTKTLGQEQEFDARWNASTLRQE